MLQTTRIIITSEQENACKFRGCCIIATHGILGGTVLHTHAAVSALQLVSVFSREILYSQIFSRRSPAMRTLCTVHENEEDCDRKISKLSHLFKYEALDQTPSSRIAK